MSALRMDGVTKRISDGGRDRVVLEGVSLEVGRGELCVLRGPSGSGKTTLLALAGSMLLPTAGEVQLDGEATSRLRDQHRAEVRRRKVGFVFQDLHLVDDMTVLENVLLPCVPDGTAARYADGARRWLARFGVDRFAFERARRLSGGERQRVALARALVREPPLLLLDEPTAHVDDAQAQAVIAELAALASQGRAVVVATHDARVADAAAVTRTWSLAAGRLVPQP